MAYLPSGRSTGRQNEAGWQEEEPGRWEEAGWDPGRWEEEAGLQEEEPGQWEEEAEWQEEEPGQWEEEAG